MVIKVTLFKYSLTQTISFDITLGIFVTDQQKRNYAKSPDISHLQAGYATNFGANQGANSNRAIETFIIESTFRVLVTRFALMHKELKMLDNSVSKIF